MIKGILFDYGGTLDTGGRHWSEVIWDGYRVAGIGVPKEEFRSAYVYAERELERNPHIAPDDTFYELLRKKIIIEMQELARTGILPAGCPVEEKAREAARYCDGVARSRSSRVRNPPVFQGYSGICGSGVPQALGRHIPHSLQAARDRACRNAGCGRQL